MFKKSTAISEIKGSSKYPDIHGTVMLEQKLNGVLITAAIYGLPNPEEKCKAPVFGFHIHEGTECSGDEKDPFADAKGHYNPDSCPHPYHAGDMPPLFGCDGYAYLSFLTNRFNLTDVIGKAIIIHAQPDDFTTQPSGNSGEKIACGIIK